MTHLVIDEISMVRSDLLDAIDARLQEIRNSLEPFGGVQVVMVGDFLQLPPVVTQDDLRLLHGLGYKDRFAFNAHVLQDLPLTSITLDQVYRQDEVEFIDLLNKIRLGQADQDVIDRLNKTCFGPHRESATPLLLTPTRPAADKYNQLGLAALRPPVGTWKARVEGKLNIAKDKLPVPELLELRVGARVMAAKNDPGGRWINGSLGTVMSFDNSAVSVQFDSTGQTHPVERTKWEKVRQNWNAEAGRIDNEVIASYSQIPLIAAWAITIHKSQGLTLDDVRIDLGDGAFAPGQVYVALSRVRDHGRFIIGQKNRGCGPHSGYNSFGIFGLAGVQKRMINFLLYFQKQSRKPDSRTASLEITRLRTWHLSKPKTPHRGSPAWGLVIVA